MKYIGLDLSTVSTGYSVFDGNKKIESGKIVPVGADVMSRIFEITDRVWKVINNFQPDEVIIEDVFYGSNYLTTKILNRLAGCVAYMIHAASVLQLRPMKITFVMPSEARKCLGILPKSTKRNVVNAVNAKFGTEFKLKDNDEADGIVLGYYGWYRDSNPTLSFQKSTGDFMKKGIRTPRLKTGKKRNVKK